MNKIQEKKNYFQEALSDFTHDMASGGAIRHLAAKGYTLDQIISQLDYPTSRGRVEKTYLRYLMDSGILTDDSGLIETEQFQELSFARTTPKKIRELLQDQYRKNGEKDSYVACPYGMWRRDREKRLTEAFQCLTKREQEYLLGLPLEMKRYYHQLNSRMYEISMALALQSNQEMDFYYRKTGYHVHICCESSGIMEMK